MAAQVVVDSGIVLATVLEEAHSDRAKGLMEIWIEQNVQLAAPMLFRYEVVAVIRRALYQNRLTPQEAMRGRDVLLALPVRYYLDDELLKRAYELATHFNRSTAYDSQYRAVAERLGCECWTADERLLNAVGHELRWVKWLGHFAGSPPSQPPLR